MRDVDDGLGDLFEPFEMQFIQQQSQHNAADRVDDQFGDTDLQRVEKRFPETRLGEQLLKVLQPNEAGGLEGGVVGECVENAEHRQVGEQDQAEEKRDEHNVECPILFYFLPGRQPHMLLGGQPGFQWHGINSLLS